ncbi:UNVERIFIED_CONTAM: hypothetical protein Scaly_1952500 [Sesamum calycinum]|uniref:Uncharacterized protein n=1 Tax=Sesamum calycinum TaxID=2727403 RepID=A0AAW2N1H9_9LAMI
MASEITEEDDEHPSRIQHREQLQLLRLHLPGTSSLLDLMKDGSTSLRRLFDMEHTSLGNYFKDYSVSPIVKPVLLWGSDSDNDAHDDPWAEIKQIGGELRSELAVRTDNALHMAVLMMIRTLYSMARGNKRADES